MDNEFSEHLGEGDVSAAIKAGMVCAGVNILDVNGVPHAVVPDGVCFNELEQYMPAPTRIKCTRKFEEPDSFCAYVGDFKSDCTRLYGSPDKFLIIGVIDDNLPNAPHWREHTALLELTNSPEWNEWIKACNTPLSQSDLADFLDEHIEQIAEPDATDLLSDIRSIHISTNTRCDSVQREGGDIAFTYSTETAAGTKTERGKIPSRLTLVIAPFRSWQPVQMTIALTYKQTKEKELQFIMRPHQADALLWMSFNDVRRHVEKGLDLPVLI